jgi:uncharacterized protein YndB with AHSA1/START domain
MPNRHPIGDPIERAAGAADVVQASVDIAASPTDVFHALADPRELTAWLGGGDPDLTYPEQPDEPSARPAEGPAGRWDARVVAPDGTAGVVTGEYGHVVPPRLLETTWRASWNDFAVERVRFELVPIDVGGVAGTRVTVTHTRAAARWLAPSSAFAGGVARAELWPTCLARLATYVATAITVREWDATSHGSPADAFDALHRRVVELHRARIGESVNQ